MNSDNHPPVASLAPGHPPVASLAPGHPPVASLAPGHPPVASLAPGHPPVAGKAAISLTTGLEDLERVTVAFLIALGAAEAGRPTIMFLTKEAVRLAVPGVAVGTACDGCPPLPDLMDRYQRAGGRYLVCPICVNAKKIDADAFIAGAELGGTVQLWSWIGDGATTFSY